MPDHNSYIDWIRDYIRFKKTQKPVNSMINFEKKKKNNNNTDVPTKYWPS